MRLIFESGLALDPCMNNLNGYEGTGCVVSSPAELLSRETSTSFIRVRVPTPFLRKVPSSPFFSVTRFGVPILLTFLYVDFGIFYSQSDSESIVARSWLRYGVWGPFKIIGKLIKMA